MMIDFEPQTLVDSLADAVRQQVLNGGLKPGARVTEHEVATTYGVARPTAKAAIERVVQSGILRRTANKTARVPLLSPEDIEEIYLGRIVFERHVVRALASRGFVPHEAVTALNDMNEAIFTEAFTDTVEADIGFHRALVDGTGNKRIARMFETVLGEAHLCMAQEQSQGAIERKKNYDEHNAILESIRWRDSDRASALMLDHLVTAAERLLDRPLELDGWI